MKALLDLMKSLLNPMKGVAKMSDTTGKTERQTNLTADLDGLPPWERT